MDQPVAGAAAATKACPRCAEEVKAAALVCRYCGYEFRDVLSVQAIARAPDAVATQQAGFFRRLTAYLIDVVGLYIPVFFVWVAMGSPGSTASNALGAGYLIALALYLLVSWTRGATLGMNALGLRVVDSDGRSLTWRAATQRLVALTVVQVTLFLVVPLVLFVIFRIFRRPYWIDRVTRTNVILSSP